MIAKNEERVIGRACRSVAHLVDWYTIILDSESDPKDASEEQIVKALGIGGQILYEPYGSVSECRNRCIAYAEPNTDYLLALDADDVIVGDIDKSKLTADVYTVRIEDGAAAAEGGKQEVKPRVSGCAYSRIILWRTGKGLHYKGVVHEHLTPTDGLSVAPLSSIVYRRYTDGRSWGDLKGKYLGHAALLKKELERDPSMATRNAFYYAQSLKDAGEYREAVDAYVNRANMGGSDQEVFVSWLSAGRLAMEHFGKDPPPSSDWFMWACEEAYHAVPSRYPEVFLVLAEGYARRGDRWKAYVYAKASLASAIPPGGLFTDESAYTWRNFLTYGVCAFSLGFIQEAETVLRAVRNRLPADQLPVVDEILAKCP